MSTLPWLREAAAYAILAVSFAGIAIGRLPGLRMNRAGIAIAGAAALVAVGGISPESALAAIDTETIVLLFAMMILVANLRISGFFDAAGARILRLADSPGAFLGVVIIASGFLSALFLNDTICIMLTPLVAEIARRRGMDGRPYLIGLATAANAGSCMTPIGNPQNMLIASESGLGFLRFVAALGVPSLLAMAFSYAAVRFAFPSEFSPAALAVKAPRQEGSRASTPLDPGDIDPGLMRKSLAAGVLLLILLAAGLRTSLAAVAAAAILLVTRRTNPEKVFAQVDYNLLAFFSGLFVLTQAVAATPLFRGALELAMPHLVRPGAAFAAFVAAASNLVSNVPAVMLLSDRKSVV